MTRIRMRFLLSGDTQADQSDGVSALFWMNLQTSYDLRLHDELDIPAKALIQPYELDHRAGYRLVEKFQHATEGSSFVRPAPFRRCLPSARGTVDHDDGDPIGSPPILRARAEGLTPTSSAVPSKTFAGAAPTSRAPGASRQCQPAPRRLFVGPRSRRHRAVCGRSELYRSRTIPTGRGAHGRPPCRRRRTSTA